MTDRAGRVVILGAFVADLAFRASRMPAIGETLIGAGFKLGPGGKGSNQAVAAARAGAAVTFISRLGQDAFGEVARRTWSAEAITALLADSPDDPTGAAFIYVNEQSGENAIIVVPGAADRISPADAEAAAEAIGTSAVFVTQLEQPLAAARRGLQIARQAGVMTVFNPAPAGPVDDEIFALCDFVTPNETEAAALAGMPVDDVDAARRAAGILLNRGAGAAVITLGEAGALLVTPGGSELVPAFDAGPVVETAGAGDAFNGGLAAALARGATPLEAVRFGCALAGLSVTRAGTAPSMPQRAEIEALLARG